MTLYGYSQQQQQDMVCADICVVNKMVYMGPANNSKKTWHVLMCSEQRGVHGSCQQQQQDMAWHGLMCSEQRGVHGSCQQQ